MRAKNMRLDENIISAVENYFKYGLPPGSFTTSLICGEYEDLAMLAHPHIRNDIDDYIWFIEFCLPPTCRGENFNTWQGYEHVLSDDPLSKLALQLATPPTSIVNRWMKEVEVECVINERIQGLVEQESEDVLAGSK